MQEVGVKTSMYLRNSYSNILKCLQTDPRTNRNVWELEYIFQNVIDISKRISDQLLSVYMADIVAVIIALQWVEEVKPDRVTVCTDSDTVNDICQRRLNDRSLSQFFKNS